MMEITKQIRQGLPTLGYNPYRQIHLHSTANPNSTAQNEADYMNRKDINSGYYSHVVGNGHVIQTAHTGKGAYDVGGGWNYETYAALELIESHKTRAKFERDYKLWVELARKLADEAKIPKTLDTRDLAGIKTHMYCTYNQPDNFSDHIDPYPYLNKWGITASQLEKDLANGFGKVPNNQQNTSATEPKIELGEIGMFIYWKARDKSGKTRDAYGVWGNKRFHLNSNAKVGHFRNIVKGVTGRTCMEWNNWGYNDETVKTVESFTELQKTVI